jgi:DNA-binding NarL/FixJ family response regulator
MRTDTSSAVACSVLVCDDRPELRAAIRLALTGNPRFIVIGEADDAVSCLDRLRETRPDVLILDVSMPGGGPEVARAVKQILPHVQILVFSSSTHPRARPEMLHAGADDYVVKTGRIRPLLDGLDRAAHRVSTGTTHNPGLPGPARTGDQG